MHILLSNDDGVQSLGIDELSVGFPRDWRITIVAPDREQSAQSHALTIQNPLKLRKLPAYGDNISKYSLSGTPADCVKFALDFLLREDQPDLVVSGINNGYNLGSDALYSGTVSAAMEALFYDIPALALSTKRYTSMRGQEIIPFIAEFVQKIYIEEGFQGLLNMNFPQFGDCSWENLRVVDQGLQRYVNIIEEQSDRRGNKYYWIGGDLVFDRTEKPTDVGTVEDGFITVTALTWKQQDEEKTAEVERIARKQKDKQGKDRQEKDKQGKDNQEKDK